MSVGLLIFLKIFLAVSIIAKAYLHSYIAYRNNVKLGAGGGFSFKALWYFTNPVQSEYESLKRTCNYIQSGNLILLLFLLVIGFFL